VRYFTLEDFPTPPPIRVVVAIKGETYVTSITSCLSPNAQLFHFSPRSTDPVSLVRTPSPLGSPPVITPMAGENPPRTRMEAIISSKYAHIVLPQPLNALLVDGYLK
jgi:hypothetical protein